MRHRRMFQIAIALSLWGCDATLAPAPQAGTSSETQTSLAARASIQDLADSLAQAINLGHPNVSSRRAALAAPPLSTFDTVGSTFYYVRSYSFRPYLNSGYSNGVIHVGTDSIVPIRFEWTTNSYADSWDSTYMDPTNQVALRQTGGVRSRIGLTFDWNPVPTSLVPEKAKRPFVVRLAETPSSVFQKIVFGNRWSIYALDRLPAGHPDIDSIPIFDGSNQIGWMDVRGVHGYIPDGLLNAFQTATVRDLGGRIVRPRPLPIPRFWLGDSLGIFYGDLQPSTDSDDLVLPYRWRFHPGTAALLQAATEFVPPRFSTFCDSLGACARTMELALEFPADSGTSSIVLHGISQSMHLANGRLETSWSALDNQSVIVEVRDWALTYPRLLP